MKRTEHAKEISNRFREMVEQSGESISNSHYDELSLLIEAGIDTALVEILENTADKIESLAHDVRNKAEHFE